MELWQMDIVGGLRLADGSEAKIETPYAGADARRGLADSFARFEAL